MTSNKIRLITATIYALKSQIKHHNFIKNNNLENDSLQLQQYKQQQQHISLQHDSNSNTITTASVVVFVHVLTLLLLPHRYDSALLSFVECPLDWFSHNVHCYRFQMHPQRTYEEAVKTCEVKRTRLRMAGWSWPFLRQCLSSLKGELGLKDIR